MNWVVAAVRPTPILWWRASGLASPTEGPASALPAGGIAPVSANIASRSVVLPLWNGSTSAMHRGPRGLLTSCPIAASSSGARPLIGSAGLMLPLHWRFGKNEKRRCGASLRVARQVTVIASAAKQSRATKQDWIASSLCSSQWRSKMASLPSWAQFQAFQPGRNAEADLALHAERLRCDRIVRSADQHVAAGSDPDRRAALRTGIITGEIARPEPRHRCKNAPCERRFLGDAEIEADLADGRDVAVLWQALGAQHAAEVGHGAHDEADARTAAAFEDADLHALHRLLRIGAGEGRHQHGNGDPGKDE